MEPSPIDDHEIRVIEIAGRIVEDLRSTRQFICSYSNDEERKLLQRAGRVARSMIGSRKMSARSANGTFAVWWVEPTPLEMEIGAQQIREALDARHRGLMSERDD